MRVICLLISIIDSVCKSTGGKSICIHFYLYYLVQQCLCLAMYKARLLYYDAMGDDVVSM